MQVNSESDRHDVVSVVIEEIPEAERNAVASVVIKDTPEVERRGILTVTCEEVSPEQLVSSQGINAMKLSEFVEQTLTQILEGVEAAQKRAPDLGGSVNPIPSIAPPGQQATESTRQRIHTVSFDVALTTTDVSGKGGGIGVAVGVFGVGGKAQASESSTSASRVQFEVPIALPREPETQ
jgi:hypothetical protein